jgi:predicted GNAT superfamily acetyltransferase
MSLVGGEVFGAFNAEANMVVVSEGFFELSQP